ncbi:Pentatricopeptide repeat-containing protein [Quillaja saponaria]|uniref:Pentatricopeptide repeat-containing protein n=1 Tax=Quillaja saponaria TaxID=32244 RepID=A0AAD7Q8R8_QUISA|nr:Pentatricopeptide repeat-containing protein [Quillaja saponaria]
MIKHLETQLRFISSCVQPIVQSAALSNFRTELSSNDYISYLCKKNLYKEALEAFDFLVKNTSFHVKPSTYANLVSVCCYCKSLEHGQKVHNQILNSNYHLDLTLQNHILNMYGKCGSMKDARKVFDAMPLTNVVSWTSMISGYSQNGQENDAIKLYIAMLRSGNVPDQLTFGCIIKACSGQGDVALGRQLHAHVLKSKFGCHIVPQNALIAMYTRFGQISDASYVFSMIAIKDLISWGSMIAGFSRLGKELEALSIFREMLSQGVYQPNEYIFGSVFSACASLLEPEYGRQIHGICTKFGLGRNSYAGCSLSDMFAKLGWLESAKIAFCQIDRPDLVSWNAIIAAFSDARASNEAISFFSQMRHLGLIPDSITFLSLLSACTSTLTLYQGMYIHCHIIKMGFGKDVPVCNSLLTMYTKCSNLYDAFDVFKDLRRSANIISWNAILTACLQHNQAGEAFSLLKQMLSSENKPDHITITTVLGACAELASLQVGYQVHCFTIKTGLMLDVPVSNGLIDMYAKCGSLKSAQNVFNSTSTPDVVSWSSLIVGYTQFGNGHEALELFRMMRNIGVQPNEVTFVAVLTACSHFGLVEEGWQFYRAMQMEHGIVPTREHCSCMVDLLARAGCLYEAEDFINKMAFDPDIVAWKTLLGACKTHGNLDMAKRAAENILKLDCSNSAALVLLCNLHASSGSWEDVAKLRSLMKEKGVKKVPGHSWIEVKDKIHVFFADDSCHPERSDVYTMLEELWLQMLDDINETLHTLSLGEPLC